MLDASAQPTLHPTFLTIVPRPAKPRTVGVTHVLDKGVPLQQLRGRLDASGSFIDIWKFGWGTAYVDTELEAKLQLLAEHGVRSCTGGTLLELAWLQGRTAEFLDWAVAVGFQCIEASNGATGLPPGEKRALIGAARERGRVVLAEVGSKDPDTAVSPQQWVAEIAADLEAGATWVVTEGRESGTVGLYDSAGSVRVELLAAIEHEIDVTQLIFESPHRAQQAWLVRHFGPNVNLGNIAADEIVAVETLRRGLRVDTIGMHIGVHSGSDGNGPSGGQPR
jgi:phosphosulfolactate synthase